LLGWLIGLAVYKWVASFSAWIVSVVRKRGDGSYYLDFSLKKTMGRVRSFYGNFNVMIKAWAYLKSLGSEGLPKVAEISVLNANYALFHIRKIEGIDVKYGKKRPCKHEFVVSLQGFKKYGVKALDFAKRLLDYGVHPPTIYFPPHSWGSIHDGAN